MGALSRIGKIRIRAPGPSGPAQVVVVIRRHPAPQTSACDWQYPAGFACFCGSRIFTFPLSALPVLSRRYPQTCPLQMWEIPPIEAVFLSLPDGFRLFQPESHDRAQARWRDGLMQQMKAACHRVAKAFRGGISGHDQRWQARGLAGLEQS